MTSWPKNPTSKDLTDALKKGFGRAYLWAKSNQLDQDVLLEACLNDYRYDTQVEDARGDWLWQLLKASSLEKQLQEQIFASLKNIDESDAEFQLCQLARHFATAGDERFEVELRHIVAEEPSEERSTLGVSELIRLNGDNGFLFAVERYGAELSSREWEWFDYSLGRQGIHWLGKEHVFEILNASAANSSNVQRFKDAWFEDRERQANRKQLPYRERVGKYTAKEVITAAESPEKSPIRFRAWGRLAEAADLNAVYQRMLEVKDTEVLRRYLQVFARCPWPRFDSRLLELCQHDDENIRRLAAHAIANNCHPKVRQFALEKLSEPAFQEFAVEILAKNYQLGDESSVLDMLVLPEDECELHWTLMSVRKLVEDNENAKCRRAVELVYDKTPCSSCRHSMVKLQSVREGLPPGMQKECQFDVERDTRELAKGPAWND